MLNIVTRPVYWKVYRTEEVAALLASVAGVFDVEAGQENVYFTMRYFDRGWGLLEARDALCSAIGYPPNDCDDIRFV